MPTITVNVDDALEERMENHPEINWSEVTRQAIREQIEKGLIVEKSGMQPERVRQFIDLLFQYIETVPASEFHAHVESFETM